MDIRDITLPQSVIIKEADDGRLSFRFYDCPTVMFPDRVFETAREGPAIITEITSAPANNFAFANGYMKADGKESFVPSRYPIVVNEAHYDPELPALAELRYAKNEPGLILTFPNCPRHIFRPDPSWKNVGEGPVVVRSIYTGDDGIRYVRGERVPIIPIDPKDYLKALIKTPEAEVVDKLYIHKVRHSILGNLYAQTTTETWGAATVHYILATDDPDVGRLYATLEMSQRALRRCVPVEPPQKATDILLGDAGEHLLHQMNDANPLFLQKYPRVLLEWEDYEMDDGCSDAIWDAIRDNIIRVISPIRNNRPLLSPTSKPMTYITMDPKNLFRLCNYNETEIADIFTMMRRTNEATDAILENYLCGGVISLA